MSREFNRTEFLKLQTISERATYLLDCPITTKTQIVDLTPVLQAFIGDIGLPVYSEGAETEADVIAKAKTWLESKVNG